MYLVSRFGVGYLSKVVENSFPIEKVPVLYRATLLILHTSSQYNAKAFRFVPGKLEWQI
jgi:hypothetical protein